MNSISTRSQIVLGFLVGFVVFAGPSAVLAADNGGDGWSDYGSYDSWSDYGSYDTWSDYGSYDTWSDYGSYDTWSDYGSYDTGTYYDDGNYYDDVAGTYYDDVYGTYYDDSYGTYYDDSYGSYYDDSYYYGGGSYSGGGSYDYGCGSNCGGGYTTPGCSFCGGGGQYTAPRFTAPSSSYTNIVTNNVDNSQDNDNYNYVTNIDNSIRDSFNNYNSGNTSIVVTAPQTPVQTTPAPYCTITHAQYGGYGSGAYLSWTSTNASSAYLSNVGSVAVSGSQTVYAQGSQTYTLTVHGYNGQTAVCSTSIQGQVYVPPTYNPPYVSLTQIPYTGFDFGPIGNAMYWVSLLGFAAAGAYLMIYYRGGALAFATAMAPARKAYAPIVAPKAPIMIEREALAAAHAETKVQPIIASLRKAAGTLDTMAIVASKDGSMPRIIIQRA